MRMKKSAFTLWLSLIAGGATAQNVVVFGDSLSDVGQTGWNNKAAYYLADGSSTLLYSEHLANTLGSQQIASSKGGTDYAYSGGVVVGGNSSYFSLQPNVSLQQQINNYLNNGVDSQALHILWGGGNDMPAILARAVVSGNATASVLSDAAATAQTSATQWATLRQAGVNFVIAPTVPNVAYTPSLFQQFVATAANQFGAQVDAVASGYGSAATAAFQQAYQAASASLNSSTQTSQADFEQARQQVLRNTVAALYSSPLGAVLAANLDQTTFTTTLLQQYQTFATQAASATKMLNEATTTALNRVGGNIVRIDTDALFSDMLARPADYGLTNTVGTVCASTTQAVCTPSDQQAAAGKLFADGFHPGAIAHKAMADYILSVLQAPHEMAVVRHFAQQGNENALNIARQESNRHRSYRLPEKTVEGIAIYQYQTDSDSLSAGFKAQFTPNWQFSALFSQQSQQAEQNSVKVKAKSKILNTTVRYDADNWWLAGGLQVNAGKYDTSRSSQIAGAQHHQQAQTSGSVVSASIFGGYEWQFDQHIVAAIADLNSSHGKLAAFGEQNSGPTRLQFDAQRFTSLQSGIGAQYRYQSANWQPFVAIRWVKEWHNRAPEIRTGLNGGYFTVETAKADSHWFNTQVGIQWTPNASGLRLYATLNQDLARRNKLNDTAIQAGIAYQF